MPKFINEYDSYSEMFSKGNTSGDHYFDEDVSEVLKNVEGIKFFKDKDTIVIETAELSKLKDLDQSTIRNYEQTPDIDGSVVVGRRPGVTKPRSGRV